MITSSQFNARLVGEFAKSGNLYGASGVLGMKKLKFKRNESFIRCLTKER